MGKKTNFCTVHVVGSDVGITEMFRQNGWWPVNHVEDADLVQFTGGPDVSPAMYGEKKHSSSRCNSKRDIYERNMFNLCKNEGVPMAGICRGAQFLHVMNGGKLFQDVDGHAGRISQHQANVFASRPVSKESSFLSKFFNKPLNLSVTSTHHQMMRHNKGILLLVSKLATRKETEKGYHYSKIDYINDPECIVHEKTRSLCYQPHPEYVPISHPCRVLYFRYLKALLS